MSIEGVVLYIGGGEAEHSAEMLRMQNFFDHRGQEGWLTASSGACTELATPGAGVTIAPGPFLINSRFPGGSMQAYMGRVLTATNVDSVNVPPGSARSDLVVMNIEDPYPSDGTFWPYPGAVGSDSRATGPYAAVRIIQNVPATCLSLDDLDTSRTERGWTCIPIARIDRPQNTGTITNSMIVNLRSIINPWAGIQLPQEILDNLNNLDTAVSELGDEVAGLLRQKIPAPAAQIDAITCSTLAAANTVATTCTISSPAVWPAETNNKIVIPPWATHMRFYLEILGASMITSASTDGVDANVYCGMRIKIGNTYSNISYQEFVEPLDIYYVNCCDKRKIRPPVLVDPKCTGRLTLNANDIGKVVSWHSEVFMASGPNTRLHNGILIALPGVTGIYFSFEFLEGPSVQ